MTNDSKDAFGCWRYPRLYWSFARYCLIRELAFRVNFIVRCISGVAWLALVFFFFQLVFGQTKQIGDWTEHQYLFFMGTGFILNALVNALFIENCSNLADLIRTGNLDFALLKPIDEQFLLTCGRVDWSTVPNIFVGVGVLVYAGYKTQLELSIQHFAGYSLLLLAGLAVMYSVMLVMAASSVWMVRNSGLYEVWFYITQFARYPADIYQGNLLGLVIWFVLTFVMPVLLAITVPARVGARLTTDGWLILYLVSSALIALTASRWFFRFALRAYRSASS